MDTTQIDEIFAKLSATRLQTYTKIAQNQAQALCLYEQNLQIAAHFYTPLQVCEVVIRNAVAQALTLVHGEFWFKNQAFKNTLLPMWQRELSGVVAKMGGQATQAGIIPSLNFAFWQSFLTKRFDGMLWQRVFFKIFTHAPHQHGVLANRIFLYQALDDIRRFRNRIAHHEPIFNKNPDELYQKIVMVVGFCSPNLAQYLQGQALSKQRFWLGQTKQNNDHWQQLFIHAAQTPTLTQLFADDDKRADNFWVQACGIYMDFSKQRLDKPRLHALLELANQNHLAQKIQDLLGGHKVNDTENRPALHTALRLPKDGVLMVDGVNVAKQVHDSLDKVAHIAHRIRCSIWRGFSGKAITDVVNIGVGGSDLGPLMATSALDEWADTNICVHFVSNMDGTQLDGLLKRLNPQTTLFIISSKSFGTVDTLSNAKTALAWLEHYANTDTILRHHFIGISTRTDKMQAWGIHEDNQLLLWEWVGGRFSMWSAIGLAIAIKIGMANFYELLAGAYEMDKHFASADFACNLPVLLGLIGVWNSTFLGINAHSVLPYDGRLSYFPNYLTQLEMESNGKSVNRQGERVGYATCPILWGDIGSNAQHAFYQLLHQGTQNVSCDFIAPIRRYHDSQAHNAYLVNQHQLALANCLAQSQVLAFGNDALGKQQEPNVFKRYRGNQPSTTLLLDSLTPKTLGSLIALYEHKVYVMSVIWDINPFDQWGVEIGKVMADSVYQALTDKTRQTAFDGSTNGLLQKIKQGMKP